MDRAAESPLWSSRLWPAQHSCKRKSPGKLFGCLLAFCLLAVFLLALLVFYLFSRHLRELQACKEEERAVRMPEFQKQTATELKPRAHLTVLNPHTMKCVQGEFPTLQWKYDPMLQSNPKDKIKYENGFLVISEPGDYFVYAQVTFRDQYSQKDNCGNSSKEVTHVTQVISKLSNGYPVPIELQRSSRSIGGTQNWIHPIYLGGIASLQENDKLLVNVSNAKLVYSKPGMNFFGAFLI
ncbi:tumor necrosis factor ligand superfamily member 15 [Heteronotia binoei]|uniref:tumor necrosis factor ligand superfamily member 15 n=1 Tax=Heteronotia binoei TaxID=13085 RepID=UPI002931F0D5|nr:tumor necrosis factor ligand superfamily member 15 [Heteronotia binoei]